MWKGFFFPVSSRDDFMRTFLGHKLAQYGAIIVDTSYVACAPNEIVGDMKHPGISFK